MKARVSASDNCLKLLAIDDSPKDLELVCDALAGQDVQVFTAPNAEIGLETFDHLRPKVVMSDFALRGMNGLELLDQVLRRDPGASFILSTAFYSSDAAVEAIRRGAYDYFSKPLDIERLRHCIRDLVSLEAARQRILHLDRDLMDAFQFQGMIGRSPLMLEVFANIRRIAPHFRSVLVTGSTGTGKELVARALHNLSPGTEAPFVVCNCSALVETLLESQLFGHVRGAFTGATQEQRGIFEYAHGGTVFLDEIGEMPLSAQAKLLRVLQNQEVQRVGSPIPRQVNVRVIAATHRDLRNMVAQGRFREDLFYRLSVVEVRVPDLAQRKEDLPLLQRHLLQKYSSLYKREIAGITRRAQMRLAAHNWPGNVRELENVISRACMLSTENVIDLQDLPHFLSVAAGTEARDPEEFLSLETMQQRYLQKVLKHVGGNKAEAAKILGVGRNTIYEMLRRLGDAKGQLVTLDHR